MDSVDVLLVDDYAAMLDLTNLQLENLYPDVNFYMASSGEEAMDYIESEQLDVIVSDYDMPGLNGLQLLDKAEEEYGEQNFVLYTCNPDIETEMENREAVYVEKGDLDSLDEAVSSLLEQVYEQES